MITLSFLISAPAISGRRPLAPDTFAEQITSFHTFEINPVALVVAENEPAAAESGSQTTSEKKDRAPQSGPPVNENSSNNSNAAETKPLKPFKPSEEIAAEQAVDFPVDI